MNSEGMKIVRDIRPVNDEQYNKVLAEYIEYVSRFNFVKAVYQIGSVGNPGISDLDLIVVVEDCHEPMSLNILSVLQNQPTDIQKYIFIHDVYVYDMVSFRNLPFSIYCDNVRQLYGRPVALKKLTDIEKRALSLQFIFDFVSSRLSQFLKICTTGQLSLRGLLVRISSIRHTYSLIQNLGVKDEETEIFIDRVMEIRHSHNRQNDQTLIELFLDSFSFFSRLVIIAATKFEEQYLTFNSDLDNAASLRLNQEQILRFVNQPEKYYANIRSFDTIYYPKSVFYHYLAFTRFPHLIGKSAACGLSHSGIEIFDLDQAYMKVLEKRLQSIVDQMNFIKRGRAYYAMGGYPGFLIPWDGVDGHIKATNIKDPAGKHVIACLQKSPMNKVIDQTISVATKTELSNSLDIEISTLSLDTEKYERWVADVFPDWREKYKHIRHKKLIELYTTFNILSPNKDDVYMDVAGGFNSYIHKLKCKRRLIQNIIVPSPMNDSGDNPIEFIQGDTANIPMPDESCTKLSCHHSFEHFQGESDSAFIREVQRLLAIGGKCCIIPIFITNRLVEVTRRYKPQCKFDPQSIYIMDPTARITGGDSCGDYARIYDIPAFSRRVLNLIDTDRFRVRLHEVTLDDILVPDMALPCHQGITMVNYPYRCLTIERIKRL